MKRYRNGCLPSPSRKRFQASGYDPVSREDLVVNKSRLNDITDWMDSLVYRKVVPPLLLCGPAGCGKSASIRVLAAEKGIEIFEWSTPVDKNVYLNSDDPEWMGPVKVSNAMKDFLLSVGRCFSIDGKCNKKLIVVKDFPVSFLNNPEEFRNIIENYLSKSFVPLVFICTDSPNKKSKDIAYELFTEEFKVKHNIVQISLLPVPVTSVVKALKRVVQRSALCINDESLKEIAQECRGDIRKALNDLKLLCVGPGKGSNNGRGMKKKGGKDKKTSNSFNNNDDESSGLFHTVGRILYAKRVPDSDTNKTAGELEHKPEDIVKQFSHYANQVVSLAHSNYLDIFSSIDSIAKASAYLSDADIIMSEWREKDLLSSVGFSVAVGGFMNSNRDPVKRFRPIHGSKWNEDMKVAGANHIQMHNVFSDYCISKVNISLEVVPFLTKMWEARNQDPRSVKRCAHGFLPHKTDLMFTALTKIKSDVLHYSQSSFPVSHCNDDFDDDPPFHISDDSD